MKKGIVILKQPTVTLEIRAVVSAILAESGFKVEPRERFDGALAVAFESENEKDISLPQLEEKLRKHSLLTEAALLVKMLG